MTVYGAGGPRRETGEARLWPQIHFRTAPPGRQEGPRVQPQVLFKGTPRKMGVRGHGLWYLSEACQCPAVEEGGRGSSTPVTPVGMVPWPRPYGCTVHNTTVSPAWTPEHDKSLQSPNPQFQGSYWTTVCMGQTWDWQPGSLHGCQY